MEERETSLVAFFIMWMAIIYIVLKDIVALWIIALIILIIIVILALIIIWKRKKDEGYKKVVYVEYRDPPLGKVVESCSCCGPKLPCGCESKGHNPYGYCSTHSAKKTPDTLFDYSKDPKLKEQISRLPEAKLENLDKLVEMLKKYVKLAEKNPGKIIKGNPILGGSFKGDYKPSNEELVASEIAGCVEEIIMNNKEVFKSKYPKLKIKYKKIIFSHVDVMGSGRFFYAHPQDAVLDFI